MNETIFTFSILMLAVLSGFVFGIAGFCIVFVVGAIIQMTQNQSKEKN